MSKVPVARVSGPLACFADGFRAELDRLGYTAYSREYKVNQMARLSRWLVEEDLDVADIDSERIGMFMRGWGNRKNPPTVKSMDPLVEWLRSLGVVPPPPAAVLSPVGLLVVDYERWMVNERGLSGRTVGRYLSTAHRFLGQRVGPVGGPAGEANLTGAHVNEFLLAECSRGHAIGTMKGRVAELRSLLRFLFIAGLTEISLAESVPPVAGWKEMALPKTMSPDTVKKLMDSCDRSTAVGRRDFAMLLLLARLGLRAAEVAHLELDDLEWRTGELVVRGKGRRDDRLPLPVDVGEALAGYLEQERPQVASRRVFLTVAAPARPLGPTAVSETVRRQCVRAGLPPVGSHRLRHALASNLLRSGVTLPEISQVLRHRDLATTAVYAKVDHETLRALALPWPAVAS